MIKTKKGGIQMKIKQLVAGALVAATVLGGSIVSFAGCVSHDYGKAVLVKSEYKSHRECTNKNHQLPTCDIVTYKDKYELKCKKCGEKAVIFDTHTEHVSAP